MSLVLDTSVVMTWCFEDEANPSTDVLLQQVGMSGATAPSFWVLEAMNALVIAQRKGRISEKERMQKTSFLRNLPIVPDYDTYDMTWTTISELAARYRLTSYDAAYLELALRLKLPLATLDKDLQRAGKKMKIEVWGA